MMHHPVQVLLWPAALASCAAVPSELRQPAEFEPQAAIWMSAKPNDAEFMRVTAGMIDALQDEVRGLLEAAFPGRTVRFLRTTPFSWNGGGPHCATLSEPRVR